MIEEYISGVPLRKVLDEEGPLSQDDAVQLIRQLCGILGPLHQLTPPIVHRDIKPSNLLLTSAGTLYLVDFNSAKESSETKNQDTVLMGTAGVCGTRAVRLFRISAHRGPLCHGGSSQ